MSEKVMKYCITFNGQISNEHDEYDSLEDAQAKCVYLNQAALKASKLNAYGVLPIEVDAPEQSQQNNKE